MPGHLSWSTLFPLGGPLERELRCQIPLRLTPPL